MLPYTAFNISLQLQMNEASHTSARTQLMGYQELFQLKGHFKDSRNGT
jgi:hypothetical protein